MTVSSFEARNFKAISVPITVFPLPADMIADILLGGLAYISYISQAQLARHIEARGWRVLEVPEASAGSEVLGYPLFHVLKMDDPSKNYFFPADLLVDCAVSLIDVDSVLPGYESLTEHQGGHWTFVYDNEATVWR